MFSIIRYGEEKSTASNKTNVLEEIKRKAQEKKKRKLQEKEDAQSSDEDKDSGIETKKVKLHESVSESETEDQPENVEPESLPAKSNYIESNNIENKFMILGSEISAKKGVVQRILPEWIQHPKLIPLKIDKKREKNIRKRINKTLRNNLKNMGVNKLFPVQTTIIPALMNDTELGVAEILYPPCDICVSSPTGSGKTLAFAIPIVQALMQRTKPAIRVLAVLPTKELAAQVCKVFESLAMDTNVRAVLLASGKSLKTEQDMIYESSVTGRLTPADIVVSTPGRLVDHLQCENPLDLSTLRFLIIDEADRMLDVIKHSWLSVVENNVYNKENGRKHYSFYTLNSFSKPKIPLQKLLFSATLSADPEKLERLNLFQPRLFTTTSVKDETIGKVEKEILNETNDSITDSVIGKYSTPENLTEYRVDCKPNEKPLIVLHIIEKRRLKKVLCFTGSVESSHRLFHVINEYNKVLQKSNDLYTYTCAEFSSHLSASERKKVLNKFKNGSVNILVCSDSMARGMDIDNIEQVIIYNSPKYIETYVHRVGRTARAGKHGDAYTLVTKPEMFHFKKMILKAGKTVPKKFRCNTNQIGKLEPFYKIALEKTSEILENEKLNVKQK